MTIAPVRDIAGVPDMKLEITNLESGKTDRKTLRLL
jgi:hypothetical protein